MRYLKLFFGEYTPPPPSWKDSFTNQLFNFISYTAKCTNNFFAFEIFESVQYFCSGLYHSRYSTFATLLSSITFLACILVAYYHIHFICKEFRKAEKSLKDVDNLLTKDYVIQSKIEESINIYSKFNEDLNMALYMSEMRRKSKEKRPERPIELEDRAPEFMPNLRAERCLKDGLSVLNIIEEKEKTPDKKSTERISPQKPNTQKKGDPKNSSLRPRLKKKSEFESHYAMKPSTADGNSMCLSKPLASSRAQSLHLATSTPRIKPRPVSRNTNNSCDRKPQKPNTQKSFKLYNLHTLPH